LTSSQPVTAPAGALPKRSLLEDALAGCRHAFVALALFSAAINVLILASPFYMMQVYDRVLNSRSLETLLLITLITLFAFATMGALEWVRSQLMTQISLWLDRRLGGEVLAAAIGAAVRHGGDRSAQGLRDLAAVRLFLTGPSLFPILDAPWVPLFLIVNFMLHPWLGALSTVGAVSLFGLAYVSERTTRRLTHEAAAAARGAQAQADMGVRNADVVQAMGMADALIARWRKTNGEAIGRQAQANDKTAILTAATKFLRTALQSLALGLGAWLVIEREATGGVMIGASIIMGRALAPVEMAIGGWRGLLAARHAFEQVKRLLAIRPSGPPQTRLPAPVGHLAVEAAVFAPPGLKEPVIKGVSFNLRAGETLAIIGPSAAGKSTLARLIVGSWVPQRGQVKIDGADLTLWDSSNLGPHIGYLPQDVELFAGTVRENIARLGDGADELVIDAAKRAHAHEIILELPNGYDTQIGDGGAFLSGGQRQRVGLARALYGAPKLVVLDEPNASLDSAAENRLLQTLFELKELNTTLVLITHKINLVNVADKVLVLKSGTIDLFGPRDAVVAKLTRAISAAAEQSRQLQTTAEAQPVRMGGSRGDAT
jgi:PrtD family type I secretion system ABC transporter